MSPQASARDWFEVLNDASLIDDVTVLRSNLSLRLDGGPGTGPRTIPFRLDTGADISVIPESLVRPLNLPLRGWPSGLLLRTASGNLMPSQRARAVRYEFLQLPGVGFRTDFAVSPNLTTGFGLLAWRDLALDFDIRTALLPRFISAGPSPTGRPVGLPGTLRLRLRPDRSPDRVG